jgi:hypothetical protein
MHSSAGSRRKASAQQMHSRCTADVHMHVAYKHYEVAVRSLAVALAMPPGGKLVAFDRDPVSMEVARR